MSVFFIDGFLPFLQRLTLNFVPNTYIYVGSSIFRLKMWITTTYIEFCKFAQSKELVYWESYEKGILALNSHGSCVINSIMNLLT